MRRSSAFRSGADAAARSRMVARAAAPLSEAASPSGLETQLDAPLPSHSLSSQPLGPEISISALSRFDLLISDIRIVC